MMKKNVVKVILLGVALQSAMAAAAQTDETSPKMSDGEAAYWYRIVSASAGMQAYAMTDNHDDELYHIPLLATENDDPRSQWKLTPGSDGKVVLTNRATGYQLNSASVAAGEHNATQLTAGSSAGFVMTSLGNGAFSLQSEEEDGVNRCLVLAKRNTSALAYPQSNVSTSVIGWKFILAETTTGVGDVEVNSLVIKVADRRVVVSGCQQWRLYNAQGEEMPRTTRLPVGTYVVKTLERTVKVVVF